MRKKQIGVLFVIALLSCSAIASNSLLSVEFESILLATDCANVTNKSTFDLHVLGRTFPVSSGYDFYGFDRGYAVFGMEPETDPLDHLSNEPTPSAVASAVRRWSESTASIYYAPKRSDEPSLVEQSQGFEVLDWHGLMLYLTSSVGGSTVKTTTYQVVVHADTHADELSITAGSPQLIADIIACAKRIDGD